MNRGTLADSTMKRKWVALGDEVLGNHVQECRAGGVARSVVQSVHGEDGF